MICKEALRQAWRGRLNHLSQTQDQLRRVAFRWVRAGQAATAARLAEGANLTLDVVRDELAALEQQGLIVRHAQGVVGISGLSLVETPHQLQLDGHSLFTWCALDAVGIAVGLRADATIADCCFHCQHEAAVRFDAGEVTASAPADLSLWLPLPQAGRSVVGET